MTQLLMMRILLIAFSIGSLLDLFMSMFGMVIIFNTNNMLGYVLCGAAAFTILALKLSAQIFYSNWKLPLFRCLYVALWVMVIVDAYAVLNAISIHIIGKQPTFEPITMNWAASWDQGELPTRILAIVLIAFLVSAPVAFSFLMREHNREEEKIFGGKN